MKQGDTVGNRFVIDEFLREHPPGAIYRAVDEKSGKKIVVTMLDPALAEDGTATERVRAAVKVATGLAHKNIVSVFGMGKEGRRRYLAREYVDGQTLAELLDKKHDAGKSFTLKGAYNLIAHVCNGLQYALPHMAHGTLRPSVVLINRTGRVKVSDFGLAALRGGLVARRDQLGRWDAACFAAGPGGAAPDALAGPDGAAPGEGRTSDDLYALAMILYALLSGRPPESADLALPDDVQRRLPTELQAILRRAVSSDPAEQFKDPNELKTELLQVIETARGQSRGGDPGRSVEVEPGGSMDGSSSIERLPPRVPEIPDPTPAVMQSPSPQAKEDGGFVIPELKPGGQVDDDGTVPRWLVERGGIDYGPYTSQQIVEQLFGEEINAETQLFDIETDNRLPIAEFSNFEEALLAWVHEKAAREKRRAEERVEAAARRRARILLTVILALVAVAGGGGGFYAWYQSTLPDPVNADLPSLVTRMQLGLPRVPLPEEELPETPAEQLERKRESAERAATRRAAAESRKIAHEARLAESSVLDASSGTGSRFDRDALSRAVSSRFGRVSSCLQNEARRDPSLKSIEIKVTVLPKGDLINVQMPNGSSAGTSCVRAALAGLKVPAFDGTNHTVTLPYQIRK